MPLAVFFRRAGAAGLRGDSKKIDRQTATVAEAEPILNPDDRDAVAGVIDEQPLVGVERLPHRHRQRLLEESIELTEQGVAVSARVCGDVLVPKNEQGDVLAVQFAMD